MRLGVFESPWPFLGMNFDSLYNMKSDRFIKSNGYTVEIQDWYYDATRLTHAISGYKEKAFHKGHNEADVIHLHFGLKGDYSVVYKQLNRSFDLLGGHHNMFYSKEFDMEFFNKTLDIETFGIQFPKEAFLRYTENANDDLKRFSEKIIKGEHVMFAEEWSPISLPIQNVIHQIIQSDYTDGLQQMFLLSKSIELIVLSTEAYLYDRTAPQIIKTNTDKEKIIAARDIINDQLQSPPNFSQISKMIGLNEYKLKNGFKEIFKTTVFNYLTDQRLNLALKLLQDTRRSAAEIAFEMGYNTPQHFNNVFRKKFGFTPNSVRKNP